MARAFVIRPWGKDSAGREFKPRRRITDQSLDDADWQDHTGEIIDAGSIRENMFSLILEADR
jgi:hypothetical protein